MERHGRWRRCNKKLRDGKRNDRTGEKVNGEGTEDCRRGRADGRRLLENKLRGGRPTDRKICAVVSRPPRFCTGACGTRKDSRACRSRGGPRATRRRGALRRR